MPFLYNWGRSAKNVHLKQINTVNPVDVYMSSQKFPALPFRQIHLDFHTSEHLEGVGDNFDKKQFQECLKQGHVQSVTSFGTCHHGWCYYDSKVWEAHPNMKTPLLPRMIEAANEIGVQTPIYLTVGWNERIARLHPDWIVRDIDGNPADFNNNQKKDEPRFGWYRICTNTPYLDELAAISREVMEQFNPVGLFYDITWEKPCFCERCKTDMEAKGIDFDDKMAVTEFSREVFRRYHRAITEAVWSINPETRVYHNGTDKKGRDDLAPYYSHYEIESLPTTDWCGGYEHFPQNARYFKHKGLDYLGMTGKFHEGWGEFGGYKHPVALRYETMRMLMLGSKCSIGDQMLPEGTLDSETYRIIGEAYQEVEAKESWCTDIKNVAEIGVICPSAVAKEIKLEEPEIGACMVLSEAQYLFDMIDEESDFSAYRLLVLPDMVNVSGKLLQKIQTFLDNGGSLIASADSGLDKKNGTFVLDYGLRYVGPSEWYIDFNRVKPALAKNQVTSPWFNYLPGPKTEVIDAETLADTVRPHFNRTFDKFCSHHNIPPAGDAGYPSVAQKGRVIYIGPKIFTMYREKGMRLHRDLVVNCVERLMDKPMLQCEVPSGAIVTLTVNEKGTHVLHFLYATPILRGDIPVLEDTPPLYNIPVQLQLPSAPKKVTLQPEGKDLKFTIKDGNTVQFILPSMELHAMIEIS